MSKSEGQITNAEASTWRRRDSKQNIAVAGHDYRYSNKRQRRPHSWMPASFQSRWRSGTSAFPSNTLCPSPAYQQTDDRRQTTACLLVAALLSSRMYASSRLLPRLGGSYNMELIRRAACRSTSIWVGHSVPCEPNRTLLLDVVHCATHYHQVAVVHGPC